MSVDNPALTVEGSTCSENAVRALVGRTLGSSDVTNVNSTHHSAPASASGYLYQCQVALLELLRRGWDEPDLVLFLESLDDVELQAGDAREALQIKHHSGAAGDLTDASVDLWRTLAVWLDILPLLEAGEKPSFTLLTTGRAPDGSAASLLRADRERDELSALRKLEAVAATSTNQQTGDARKRFTKLQGNERMRLVQAIEIRDERSPIADFDNELERELKNVFRRDHRDDFLAALGGWWYRQCRRLLTDRTPGVTGRDLSNEIARLRDGYAEDNLPQPLDPASLSKAELANYADHPFVKQLEWIVYSNEQIVSAIHDFYNAEAERSRWLRTGLLALGDLEDYEQRLVHTWRLAFQDMVRELGDEMGMDAAKEKAGRLLLQQLRTQDRVRVRARFSNDMITHGTLHELADCERPYHQQIGWHPDYKERLEALLELATE